MLMKNMYKLITVKINTSLRIDNRGISIQSATFIFNIKILYNIIKYNNLKFLV